MEELVLACAPVSRADWASRGSDRLQMDRYHTASECTDILDSHPPVPECPSKRLWERRKRSPRVRPRRFACFPGMRIKPRPGTRGTMHGRRIRSLILRLASRLGEDASIADYSCTNDRAWMRRVMVDIP